jgi:hypothetical protein
MSIAINQEGIKMDFSMITWELRYNFILSTRFKHDKLELKAYDSNQICNFNIRKILTLKSTSHVCIITNIFH